MLVNSVMDMLADIQWQIVNDSLVKLNEFMLFAIYVTAWCVFLRESVCLSATR